MASDTYRGLVSIFRDHMRDSRDTGMSNSIIDTISNAYVSAQVSEEANPSVEDLFGIITGICDSKKVPEVCNGTHRRCIREFWRFYNVVCSRSDEKGKQVNVEEMVNLYSIKDGQAGVDYFNSKSA